MCVIELSNGKQLEVTEDAEAVATLSMQTAPSRGLFQAHDPDGSVVWIQPDHVIAAKD
jgi:hypothetical protein